MITAREIRTFSEKLGVPARTIDKDWVLGHFLVGIFDKNKMISTKREWANSLNYHLTTVPGFDHVIADIKEQIDDKKIFMEH